VTPTDPHCFSFRYDNTGIQQRADAFKRRKEALSIRKQVFEEADPRKRQDEILLYNSWMEYAISLLHYHRYEQAEPIIKRCLAKFEEWGPEKDIPFEYSKYYNKIALVRMYQGRFKEAIGLAEKSVQLMHKTGFGLFMTRFKFDMACIVLQSGDLDRALRLHQEIYNQRIEMVGITNELSLHSMYAIGALYELKEDFHQAEYVTIVT
jgi:tetratricopeptide (TPR) repeat protein